MKNTIVKNSFQLDFIEKIKNVLPPQYSLVDELTDLLTISNDSAYRRLRGDTPFTIEEVKKVCDYFKVSFDAISGKHADAISFNYNIARSEKEFISHLQSIRKDLLRLHDMSSKKIIYAAIDIPFFYLFKFPELANFKMFYWVKSVINEPRLISKKYHSSILDPEIMNIGKDLLELYCEVPSTEIWTEHVINSLYKQIEFYWDSDLFGEKKDAVVLCDQFIQLLHYFEKMSACNRKYVNENKLASLTKNFNLHYSEIEIGNNCILTIANQVKMVYLTHQTFNKIETVNQKFSEETYEWMNHLVKKSVLISGAAEKQRLQFFSRMLTTVEQLKLKICAGHNKMVFNYTSNHN